MDLVKPVLAVSGGLPFISAALPAVRAPAVVHYRRDLFHASGRGASEGDALESKTPHERH